MSNNEKEIITNALLEASQNLLNKIDINVEKIDELKTKLSGGYQEEKKEKKNSAHPVEKFTFL